MIILDVFQFAVSLLAVTCPNGIEKITRVFEILVQGEFKRIFLWK